MIMAAMPGLGLSACHPDTLGSHTCLRAHRCFCSLSSGTRDRHGLRQSALSCSNQRQGAATSASHGDRHGSPGQPDERPAGVSRRTSGAALVAAAAVLAGLAPPAQAFADADAQPSAPAVDTTITDKVYLDIGLCPEMLNRQRTVGSKTALCTDPMSLGRIVIGLYGKHLPITVSNFRNAVQQGLYTGTIFHKVLPGAFVQAGRQGSKRQGEVFVPKDSQQPNPELLQGASYRLPHMRPGTVSLMLSQNDDYPDLKQARDYHDMQFLITTGPGPVPVLDGENVVFGRVLEGLETIGAISTVPTFSPGAKARQMNAVASFLGDDRAAKARAKWGRPLKAVVITDGGTLNS